MTDRPENRKTFPFCAFCKKKNRHCISTYLAISIVMINNQSLGTIVNIFTNFKSVVLLIYEAKRYHIH